MPKTLPLLNDCSWSYYLWLVHRTRTQGWNLIALLEENRFGIQILIEEVNSCAQFSTQAVR